MQKFKRTKWFRGVTPVHVGDYEVQLASGDEDMSEWDGNAFGAHRNAIVAWRGQQVSVRGSERKSLRQAVVVARQPVIADASTQKETGRSAALRFARSWAIRLKDPKFAGRLDEVCRQVYGHYLIAKCVGVYLEEPPGKTLIPGTLVGQADRDAFGEAFRALSADTRRQIQHRVDDFQLGNADGWFIGDA
jgi:hypothetical protein